MATLKSDSPELDTHLVASRGGIGSRAEERPRAPAIRRRSLAEAALDQVIEPDGHARGSPGPVRSRTRPGLRCRSLTARRPGARRTGCSLWPAHRPGPARRRRFPDGGAPAGCRRGRACGCLPPPQHHDGALADRRALEVLVAMSGIVVGEPVRHGLEDDFGGRGAVGKDRLARDRRGRVGDSRDARVDAPSAGRRGVSVRRWSLTRARRWPGALWTAGLESCDGHVGSWRPRSETGHPEVWPRHRAKPGPRATPARLSGMEEAGRLSVAS